MDKIVCENLIRGLRNCIKVAESYRRTFQGQIDVETLRIKGLKNKIKELEEEMNYDKDRMVEDCGR